MTNYTYGNLDPRYVQAIRGFEGFKPKAAWDVRQNSNGYGTRALYPGEVIDRAEAERRLHNELTHAAGIVDGYAANLDPSTRAALVSLTYNSGGDWMKSGLGQAVKAGDWDAARQSFGQYTKAGGQHLPGLAIRRNAELGWFGDGADATQPAQGQPQPGPVQATYPFPAPMALGAPREAVQAPSEVLAQNYGAGTPQPSSAPQWDTGAFWAGKAAESKADGGPVPTADEILAEYSDPVGQFHHKLLEKAPIVPPWDRPGTKSPVTGTLSNPPDRPSDWAVKSGVAETVSPTMGAYGVGSILGEVAGATKAGNLGEAGMNALPLGAMFLGPGAKTANKTNMLRAQEMHAKGLPREAIWKDTGWFQGVDGKWRYEIDDSKARLTDWDRHKHGASNVAWDATAREKSGVTKTPTGMNTEDFIEHPELAKAYWPLRDEAPAVFYDRLNGRRGQYEPHNDFVTMDLNTLQSPDGGRGTALHEYQHAVQEREGFARGANTQMFPPEKLKQEAFETHSRAIQALMDQDPQAAEAYRALNRFNAKFSKGKELSPAEFDEVTKLEADLLKYPVGKQLADLDWTRSSSQSYPDTHWQSVAYDRYKHHAGETEARTVQKRMNMTPEERAARPPWLDYDVPEGQQIVRYGDGGPQASASVKQEAKGIRAYHGSPHDFDKFSMEHIGKGEGAQAYGHGLYFAENEGVAKFYRDQLAPELRKIKDTADPYSALPDAEAISKLELAARQAELNGRKSEAKDYKDASDWIKSGRSSDFSAGRMYEVNIKADPEHFLDWDKPLSAQSEIVQKNLMKLPQSHKFDSDQLGALLYQSPEVVPGQFYDKKAATAEIQKAGIPGIRYLDQGSRSLGDGSRNYVVFDPTMIEIMRKYGLIPPLAVGAGAAVTAPATDAQPLNYANGGAVHRALKVAEKSVNRTPSDAQKEAGNYAKGHLTYKGLNVTIENPKGSERSGMGRNGKRWSVKMPAAYGYVKSTEGYDGDHVDVYLGPDHDSDKVFVVDQINAETGKFDEHKCMLSYPSKDDALADYRKAFSDGKASDRIGAVTEMTMDRFKSWVKSPGTKVPLGDIRKGYADGGPVPTADEILSEYSDPVKQFHHKFNEGPPVVAPWDRPNTRSPVTGTLTNYERPADWAVKSGVAEMASQGINPMVMGHGLGSAIGEVAGAAKAGDYGHIAGIAAPMAAMAVVPMGPKGMKKPPALDSLGYYSGALESARNLPQAKGTPQQMLAMMQKGGAKAGEIEATGLGKWLEENYGSTTSTARGEANAITVPPSDPAKYIKTSEYERGLLAPYAEGASSRQVPFAGELPAVGSWRMSDRSGLYGRDIEHLRTFKPEDLLLPEVREGKLDPTKRGDDERYAQWMKEGKRPPPVEVLQMDDGRFRVMDGHRRVLAAKQAGQPIDAWVSYSAPTGKLDANGQPIKTSLTYELAQSNGERISGQAGTADRLKQNLVTRDDIANYLERNRVGLNEVQRKGYDPLLDAKIEDANRRRDWDEANRLGAIVNASDAKWQAHSLDPSNPTYRETVLHLPESRRAQEIEARMKENQRVIYDMSEQAKDLRANPDFAPLRAARSENAKLLNELKEINAGKFQSGHFPEPNIVGHMMTSMTKHEGKPVYTIDQIQSDWGQKLRDGGVRDEAKIKDLHTKMLNAKDRWEEAKIEFPKNDPQQRARPSQLEYERIRAELATAEQSPVGHPLVNTTDQWTNTTLRRALQQAIDAKADHVAIPTGDTVLSYNPGDTAGMHGFYGRGPRQQVNVGADLKTSPGTQSRAAMEGIVPKNLRKMLLNIDRDHPGGTYVNQLETPSGMKGQGFTMFPITPAVREYVKKNGLPLFTAAPVAAAIPGAINDPGEGFADGGSVATPDEILAEYTVDRRMFG